MLFNAIAVAQVSSGSLVGTVLDPSGAAVPKAKVEVKNLETNVVSSTTTDDQGAYRVNNLVAGNYSITASASGFSTSTLQNVTVDANKIATANVTLQVGTTASTVEVTESVAVIDTTTATIQNTFSTQLVRDLPVSGLGIGVANLALLNAGVTSSQNLGTGEGPSVGGQRPYNNNFMIEGVDDNNRQVTGSLIRFVPNDAVSEFTVLQNQESAQYGHSSGGQFNIILKSGTNEFHGSAYEYLQNRNLNAIDQTVQNQAIANGVRPVNPRHDENRFGGSFGGPIKKDKLFFFALYDYNPVGKSATPAAISAPTAQGMAALSAIPGLNATNLGVFKKYVPTAAAVDPTLTPLSVSGVTIPVGTLQFASPNYQNNQDLVTTFDYSISDKDQLRGRYIYNRLAQIDVQANLPQFFTFNNDTYHVATLAEYHNFSPNLVNEFRLGYNRINQPTTAGNFKFPGLDAFPDIVINELGLDIGPNPNAPQFTGQNTYQLQDNVTWVRGRHTFQFGFDGRRTIAPSTFTQRSRGDYEWNSLETFLLDITPDSLAQRSLGNPVYYGDQYGTYEYAQDTWRFRPNLTLNLGLRYEYTTVPVGERSQKLNAISSVPGFLTFGEPQPSGKNFAPRIGVAYSPGSKGTTSIRAGFGMAYDVLYDNIGILALPPQLSTTVDVTAPLGTGSPGFLAHGGILPNAPGGPALTAAQARAATSAYIPDQKLPYSIQWNLGVQHVFANNYTVEVRYLGTRGVHLDVQDRINKRTVITPTNSLPTYLSAPTQAQLDALPLTLTQLRSVSNLVPAFAANGFTNAAFVEDSPIGWSSYHGLAIQANRRFSNGLQFQAAYTWSRLIDNSTADFNTTALSPRRPQDFQNLTAEKATSALDRRNRLTFAAYYEVPWFKKSNWMMKNIVGNWTAAPVYTYESPEWATVQSQFDANLNGDAATDRAIINPAGQDGVGSGITTLKNSSGQTVAYLANNPNARYIRAGLGAYANSGRNTLPGRPVNNVDMSLLKNFNVTERYKLQFAAQFFNFFNHPQFTPGFPNRVDVVNANYNNGAADRNYLTPGNAIFNNPEAVFSSNPRFLQLGLKFIF
jgi:outer membrane receptor protein involved in Fe transport